MLYIHTHIQMKKKFTIQYDMENHERVIGIGGIYGKKGSNWNWTAGVRMFK